MGKHVRPVFATTALGIYVSLVRYPQDTFFILIIRAQGVRSREAGRTYLHTFSLFIPDSFLLLLFFVTKEAINMRGAQLYTALLAALCRNIGAHAQKS